HDPPPSDTYTLSLHDALPILRTKLLSWRGKLAIARFLGGVKKWRPGDVAGLTIGQWLDTFGLPEDARRVALFLVRTTTYLNDQRSEEHTSELQSRSDLVCRLL